MSNWSNPNINPPEETTPEEAERDKRTMGKKKAAQESKNTDDVPGPVVPHPTEKSTE